MPGAYLYWPDNPFWSFQLLRLFSQANAGAAELTEVHLAVRDLEAGDIEGWYAAFIELARRVESQGDDALVADDRITARDAFKRATNYYRTAGFFLLPTEPRYHDTIEDRRRSFQKAIPLDDMSIETVEIPFESGLLPGYLISAPSYDSPRPVVIISGGADSVCEELYFALGRSLAERGYLVVTFDGPGQGEALRRGIVARADWEAPIGAVVDLLEGVTAADAARIGFVGQSLGGLYGVRVAAYEPRVASVVAWGAQWNIQEQFKAKLAVGGPAIDHLARWFPAMLGADDLDGAVEKLAPFRADQDAAQVRRPLLVLHGEADTIVPAELARRLYDAIPREDKELKIIPYGEPGCEHCQVDSIYAAAGAIGPWFAKTLIGNLAGSSNQGGAAL